MDRYERRKITARRRRIALILMIAMALLLILFIVSRDDSNDENKEAPTTQEQETETSSEETVADPNEVLLPEEYFNEVEEVDGVKYITNTDNMVQLVNSEYHLPSDYIPPDLVVPDVEMAFGDTSLDKAHLRQEAADALELMFADAAEQGIELVMVSGYRSYDRQEELFEQEVAERGSVEAAAQWVAVPGTSEHQTGLAVDISAKSVNCDLVEEFGSTAEGIWLQENAHEYGFILRYPAEDTEVTGINYEPWHFRYVGVEVATDMYNRDMCLEVYMQTAKPI